MRENECSLPYGFMELCRYSERSPYLSSFLDFFSPSGEPSFLVSSAKPIAIRCSAVCLSTERTSPLAMKLPWIVVSVRIRIRGIYSPMDLRIARARLKAPGAFMFLVQVSLLIARIRRDAERRRMTRAEIGPELDRDLDLARTLQ